MKLPHVSFLQKKEDNHYYLAILLRDESVSAVIFKEDHGTIRLLHTQDEKLSTLLEETNEDALLAVFDKAISLAEEYLPKGEEVSKTVFGLKETWVEEGKIKKQYLQRLKKICDELDLTPIGFMVFSEAVSHLLQKEEGAPVSAVFAEIGQNALTVSLLKGGKVISSKTATILESVPKSVDTLLKHFDAYEVLPPRLIVLLIGEKEHAPGEKINQAFMNHTWSKDLPFLHVPQVQVLPKGFDARAVLFGAASQMGFEVLDHDLGPKPHVLPMDLEDRNVKEEDKGTDAKITTEGFGFVQNEDIAQKPLSELQVAEPENQSIRYTNPSEIIAAEEEVAIAREKKFPLPISGIRIGGAISSFFSKLKVPKLGARALGGRSRLLLLIIPLLIVLLLGGFIYLYFFVMKTTIVITTTPKAITKEQAITIVTNGSTDTSQNTLGAQTISLTEDGSVTQTASGKKEVGDKAKGNVTLYNSDIQSHTLSSGTTMTAPNGTKFTLDKDVTVASASGDIFTGIKSGTTQASVTASSIGTEGNLPSGTKFTVDGSFAIAARNDNAFSGGSKKNVTVVTSSDVTTLTQTLQQKLQDKGKSDITQKVGNDNVLISDTLSSSISKKQTDKKTGDQADTVTLTGTVSFSAVAYKKNDVLNFANDVLNQNTQPNQEIQKSTTKVTIGNIKQKSDKTQTATMHIDGSLLPKLNTDEIAQKLVGKSFTDAQNIAKSYPQVSNVLFTHNPPLPLFPDMVSSKVKNITVTVEAK